MNLKINNTLAPRRAPSRPSSAPASGLAALLGVLLGCAAGASARAPRGLDLTAVRPASAAAPTAPASAAGALEAPGAGQASGPDAPAARIERRLAAMGTWFSVAVEAPERGDALRASEAAFRALREVERRLSSWDADSELSAINAAQPSEWIAVSESSGRELERALELRALTGGAFDPTIGRLVRGSGDGDLLDGPNRCALEFAEGRVRRVAAGTELADGGWVKGAGLDAAALALGAGGATFAALDLGGQWFAFGRDLEIDIAHPDDRELAVVRAVLPAGWSAATSGNGQQPLDARGERVAHLIDPASGAAARDFGSVTVLCPRALDADALSTGLFVAGPAAALDYAEIHADCEVLVLERSAEALHVRHSAGLAVRALDPAVSLAPPAKLAPTASFDSTGGENLAAGTRAD